MLTELSLPPGLPAPRDARVARRATGASECGLYQRVRAPCSCVRRAEEAGESPSLPGSTLSLRASVPRGSLWPGLPSGLSGFGEPPGLQRGHGGQESPGATP